MISTDRGTGHSWIELEDTYSTKGLTSLEVEQEPSYEGLKFEVTVTTTVTVRKTLNLHNSALVRPLEEFRKKINTHVQDNMCKIIGIKWQSSDSS